MKKLLIMIPLVLMVSGGAAQGPTVKLETDVMTTDPVPLQSGEDGDITFRIRNTGNTATNDLNVTIIDTFPFELKPDRKRSYDIGELNPGETYYISTEVLVADKAPDGSNDLRLSLDSNQITITKNIPLEVQSEDIQLDVTNLGTEPTDLGPDTKDASLIAEVANNGDKTAENAVMRITLPEDFDKTSSFSTRQSLGNIAPGQVKKAEFVFDVSENAVSGEKDVPASLSYSAGDSTNTVTVDRSFSLYLSGRPQYEVVNFTGSLMQGDSGKLTLKFRNVGDEESSSTRVRVLESGDQPFTYSSASDFVGTVEPGTTGTATFELSADSEAEAREHLVDFEFRGVKDTEIFVEDTTQRVEVTESTGGTGFRKFAVIGAGVLLAVAIIGLSLRKTIVIKVKNIRK